MIVDNREQRPYCDRGDFREDRHSHGITIPGGCGQHQPGRENRAGFRRRAVHLFSGVARTADAAQAVSGERDGDHQRFTGGEGDFRDHGV